MSRVLAFAALCALFGAASCGSPPPSDAEAATAAAATAAADEVDRDHGGEVWGADYFPNVTLTTHEGREVKFFDDVIAGKVVAINFIYTHCPDACPMETARLRQVYELLGDRVGKDVFFYSISIDPTRDTPEVLKGYVESWQIGPGWTFLTGSQEDVDLLRKKLGVYSGTIEEIKAKLDHNLSLVIGNQATGRWMRRSPYENPYILANQLGSWLHNWKLPSDPSQSYENAPDIRPITTGENLFRTRCASCHTVGGGEISLPEERRVGPDLYNITKQRDRAWLSRWIVEPDQMIAEGDPIAVALLEQYRGITMPNLRMTSVEVDHLLAYFEEESGRIDAELERRAPNAPPPAPHAGMNHQP